MENLEARTKKCSKCGRELPASEFYVKKGQPTACKHGAKSVKKEELGLIILTSLQSRPCAIYTTSINRGIKF